MIGVIIFSMALAATPTEVQPQPENHIEVIGRKLRDWRGSWKLSGATVTCETQRSSGDLDIDAIGCDAMTSCIQPLAPQLSALEQERLSKRKRKARLNELLDRAGIGQCIFNEREAGIAALVTQRRSEAS